MLRTRRILRALLLPFMALGSLFGQQSKPVQMASLRPAAELHWQRTSPSPQHSDGPVLYQLVFTPGTPGTIAKFDTNTRHLVSSDISDLGGIVAIGSSGFTINVNTGIVNFVNTQTFPNAVTNIASGAGLTGGPITSTGTLSLDTNFTNSLYSRSAVANTFTTGTQVIQTGAAGTVGLAVQGASAQTANLEEWRNNSSTAVASISASGKFSGDGSGLTNLSNSQISDGGLRQRKAAMMQWYRRDFNVGRAPTAVAFDSTNIWVTNVTDGTISKVRASDGAIVATYSGFSTAYGIAFDGSNMWVATVIGPFGYVSKVRASDGTTLGTFAVGTLPKGVAFDGNNIWVANQNSNNVTKLRASDGANQGTFTVGSLPQAVAFDGANIWVVNAGDNTVTELRASDGATLNTFPVGSGPAGVAFDGANIWVTNQGDNNVTKLRASDGANLGTFSTGSAPWGVAFDGSNIWVANYGAASITKLRALDGTNLSTFSTAAGPIGVASDGANIWTANQNNNSVSKF